MHIPVYKTPFERLAPTSTPTRSRPMKDFDTRCGLYMKQVKPYVQRTFTVDLNADNVRAWCTKHTDEMFGNGRTASRAVEKARKAERRAQEAAKKAPAESLKDKFLKKTQMVEQPVADEADVTGAPHHAKEVFGHEAEKKENLQSKRVGVRDAYGTAARQAETLVAKVVEAGKGAEEAVGENVKSIKKAAQDHVENTEEVAKESFDSAQISAD
ncbi:MAG: hypothetical protein J3Q66DRAFT_368686 [Benniella sp.]|nr:MAG: hypothetical protein J3Q66DRAFT_368686 [Benniella sp.]